MNSKIFFAAVLILYAHLLADSIISRHCVYFEIGGQGLTYSLGYECEIYNRLVANSGISFLNLHENQTEKNMTMMTFPVSISYLQPIFNDQNKLELGLGAMNLLTSGDLVEYKGVTDFFINPGLILGYRFIPESNKWHFKTSFNPFWGTTSITDPNRKPFTLFNRQMNYWGGIAVGYNF